MKYFINILLLVSLLFNYSCNNSTEKENNLDQVLYSTNGIISNSEDIEIKIDNALQLKEISQEDLDGLFSFNPEIKGHAERISADHFKFIPERRMDFNTEYSGKFNLGKILLNGNNTNHNFNFRTKQLRFNVTTKAFNSYSKEYGKFKTKVTVNDFVNIKELKTVLKIDPKLKSNFKYSNPDDFVWNEFFIDLDSVKRESDDKTFILSYDASHLNSESVGEYEITVPGKNKFRILNVEVITEPNQEIIVNFSDPIQNNQNFEGLVQLKRVKKLNFTVNKSQLHVFPKTLIKTKKGLTILKDIKSEEGYKLKHDWTSEVEFEQAKPEVKLLSSNASILPNSSGLKINFTTQKLTSIEVEVFKIHSNNILQFLQNNPLNSNSNLYAVGNKIHSGTLNLYDSKDPDIQKKTTHSLNLEKLIEVDPGAIYRVSLNFNPNQVVYTCSSQDNKSLNLNTFIQNFDPKDPFKGTTYKDRRWENRNNPCNISFYLNNRNRHKPSMNILASNLGVTLKKDQKNRIHCYVLDMVTNEHVSDAKVSIYTYQQQLIGQASTKNGSCVIDIKENEEGSFAIVSKGQDKMYLKIDNGNALSLSNFDVSGGRIQSGLTGFVYLDRGVRRPGDKIPVTFVLDDTENPIPPNHPVIFEWYDPEGKLVNKKTVKQHLNRVFSTQFVTKKEDKTGNWRLAIKVGGANFSKNVKVETIKPNRLKINTTFDEELILDLSKPITGNIASTWLHGAPANNLKTDITVKLQSKNTIFKGYQKYNFNHSYKKSTFKDYQIFNGKLNELGQSSFTYNLNLGKRASGFLKANFITKVYEKGGDFSINVISKDASTYPAYVGVSIPKGKGYSNTLVTDKRHNIDVVCLSEDSKPLKKRKLKARIYKIDWSWWWQSRGQGISNYLNSNYHNEVLTKDLTTNNEGLASFDFEIIQPDWGRFLVIVEDLEGGHISSQTIYLDWPEWIGRSRGSGPNSSSNHLDFTTDKNSYKINDIAKVTIPSVEAGKVLVSIENGIEVIETHWVDTKTGETKFEFPISEAMTPNAFIVINHFQKHKNTVNELPMRLYGIKGIEVVNPATKLSPEIKMPKTLEPEKEFEISISETEGKEMTYTIQVIDDGLLDLTNYKTPNPWNSFYSKRALGVRTWDIYDDVIGAYGGTINQILAIGGDADLAGGKSKSANRFKPVALHFGPFHLEKNQHKKHRIKLPN